MNPLPYVALAAALLSVPADRTCDGYVALAAGDPSLPLLALTTRGDLWRIAPVARDPARCTRIASAAPFAAIARNAAGRYVAITMTGAVAQDGWATDCRAWRDGGLIRSPCRLVALSACGSADRLVALSACGELFVGGPASGSWEFWTRIPDSLDRFVALGQTPNGGLHALTVRGRVWTHPDAAPGGRSWTLSGELPREGSPYVAIVSGGPAWILSASGDLATRDPATGRWSLFGRIPPPPGAEFTAMSQDAAGNAFALATNGTVWNTGPAPSDCAFWRRYAELPWPGPDATPDAWPGLALSLAPNPVQGRATVHLNLPAGGFTRLDVYDAAGRMVRLLLSAESASGSSIVAWDGFLDDGRRAPPGVYFMRLRSGGLEAIERFQVIR
jgi:hypothetical protein